MMKKVSATIVTNEKVAAGFFRMRLCSAYLAKATRPGQFIEARCADGLDPLLNRPFSAHRILDDGLEILYEVVGTGTRHLSERRPGGKITVIGPLGNGFALPSASRPVILIAGGIGVAPLVALAELIVRRARKNDNQKRGGIRVILGGRTKSHILCEKEFRKVGALVSVVTEDGSRGRKGLVTDALKDVLRALGPGAPSLYACGPVPMFKAIWDIAKENASECQFSYESHMACGLGVCCGCPVKIRKELIDFEYKMVCKDGPVFKAEEIVW